MKFNKILTTAALANALACSGIANADIGDTYTLDYTLGAHIRGVTISNPLSAVSGSVAAGLFTMTEHENTGGLNFKAFCVDIFNTIYRPAKYTQYSIESAGWTSAQLARVNYLFDSYGESLNNDPSNSTAGAFQLVLWEIINESDNPLNIFNNQGLRNGDFSVSMNDTPTRNLAEGWITDIWKNTSEGFITKKFELTFWDGENSQNLLSFNPLDPGNDPGETAVPEPAPLVLLCSGLLALGLMRRKVMA